jgi:hypothetical protein
VEHDIYSNRGEGSLKFDALARKCRLDSEDEERALSVYEGMIDAIADRISTRDREPSAPPAVVYIAAYQHRFGVDLSAHGSRDNAESRLLSIAWQQCMSDAAIRAAVDARFGPLVSEEPPLEPPFEADLHRGEDEPDGGDLRWEVPVALISRASSTSTSTSSSSPIEDTAARPDAGSEEHREKTRRTFCEKLLEEWPEFARGEALWIVECAVEQEDEPARWQEARDMEDLSAEGIDGGWP